MTHDQLARIGYEANAAYAATIGESPVSWDAASADDRRLWVLAARHVVAFSDAPAERLHQIWHDAEVALGWRWGPVLDNEAKCHPYVVRWHALPEPQRAKVRLFKAIANALLFNR